MGRVEFPSSAVPAPIARMASLAPLGEEERKLVSAALAQSETHRAGSQLIAESAPFLRPRFVISGWVCRARTFAGGRRQIFDLYLPGEIMGYSRRSSPLALGSYLALTRAETADAGEVLRAAGEEPQRYPGILSAFERASALEECYLLAQIARIGRLTAYERFANFVLELMDRMRVVGLVEDNSFPMPLTQEALGDSLGLSIVHINRTVQQLKRENLVRIGGAMITLPDPERLIAIADYREPRVDAADLNRQS